MGWFKKDVYVKTASGRWKLERSSVENAPTDYGRWKRSCELEKNSSLGEKTYFTTDVTRTGINRKVTEVRTYFGKNKKVVRKLITTSSKLPKNIRK